MKLHIEFDDAILRRYQARGANPVFTIYWKHNGAAYPEVGWTDFGSVVLSWWLVATTSLLHGARLGEFLFMDGSYQLDVRAVNDLYHISSADSDMDWHVAEETFVRELLTAAKYVRQKFADLAIPDRDGLKQGIMTLEIANSARRAAGAAGLRTKASAGQ